MSHDHEIEYNTLTSDSVKGPWIPLVEGGQKRYIKTAPIGYEKSSSSHEDFRPDYYALPNRLEDLVKDMPMFQGTATKYLVRAGKKNPDKIIEDLKKAAECLKIEIERLENGVD